METVHKGLVTDREVKGSWGRALCGWGRGGGSGREVVRKRRGGGRAACPGRQKELGLGEML